MTAAAMTKTEALRIARQARRYGHWGDLNDPRAVSAACPRCGHRVHARREPRRASRGPLDETPGRALGPRHGGPPDRGVVPAMSTNTRAAWDPGGAPAPTATARTVEQARMAWVTASRDTELDRWRELYGLAVPRPRPEMRAAA